MSDLFGLLFPEKYKVIVLRKNNPSYTRVSSSWTFGIEEAAYDAAIRDKVTHVHFLVTMAKPSLKDAQAASDAGFRKGDTYRIELSAVGRYKRHALSSNGTYYMVPVDKMEKIA